MAGMNSAERRLWLTVVSGGLVLLALTALLAALSWSAGSSAGGVITLLMIFGSNPAWRRDFESLSNGRRALLMVAIAAISAVIVVVGNRKMPSPFLFDIGELAAIAALLLLYTLFSKAMDALWARFSRR